MNKGYQGLALDKKRSDFLSFVTHELRSPIASLIDISNFLVTEPGKAVSEEKKDEYLGFLNDTASDLLELVEDLLDFNQSSKCEFSVDKEDDIDVSLLIKRAIRLVRGMAFRKGVYINFIESDNITIARCDSRRMIQVIVNLLVNAMNHSKPGDTVGVELENTHMGFFFVIKDSGTGMSQSQIKQLLGKNKTFRLKKKVKSEASNSSFGIGFQIIKMIVEQHDGKILIDSFLGKGTKVSCFFPKRSQQEAIKNEY